MGIQGLNQMLSAYQNLARADQKAETERQKETRRAEAGCAKKAGAGDARKSGAGEAEKYGESAVYTRSEDAIQQYENISMRFTATHYSRRAEEQEKAEKAEKTKAPLASAEASLSDTAKAYLKTLRERYGNMDFIIADYASDEQANALLATGRGQYNVLIDPETLEKMASDEKVRAKYEDVLNHAGETFDKLKEELGEDAGYIKQLGLSVDGSGKTTYYSIIDESLKGSGERLKKQQEAKAEKAKEEKRAERRKDEKPAKEEKNEIWIESDSLEDFIAKIREAIAGFKR